MIGFSRLLMYPSHPMMLTIWSGKRHLEPQKGRKMASTKKGNQQRIKVPVMIARVLAALRSRINSMFAREGALPPGPDDDEPIDMSCLVMSMNDLERVGPEPRVVTVTSNDRLTIRLGRRDVIE
jgi:hypothetical protein